MATGAPSHIRGRTLRIKAALLAVGLTLAGVLLIMLGGWLDGLQLGDWEWLHALPFGELGGILLGAGLIGTLNEYSFRKEQDEAAIERFREIIHEQAPAMRDAVIEGFAIHPEDLKRVANPELLDDIASNVMALRLGDQQFAREMYAQVRDQGIQAPERWYDVEVSVRLSTAVERSSEGTPLFDVTVEWQYTTVPSHAIRRFACVSDRAEFNELVREVPVTSTWFMRARPGMDASSRDSYELLSFAVDGEERSIRRLGRKTGQTYSVNIGDDIVSAERPVRIRHVYRTVTSQAGHWLFFEIPQPSKEFSLRLDYSSTDVSRMSVMDLVTSLHSAQINHLPTSVAGKVISVDVPGWLLPKAGLAFVWTLSDEEPTAETTPARAAQARAGYPGE